MPYVLRTDTDDIVTSCVRLQVPHFYILKFFALPLWCPVLMALFFPFLLRALVSEWVCGHVLSSLLLLFIFHLFFFPLFLWRLLLLVILFFTQHLSISASRENIVCARVFYIFLFLFSLLLSFALPCILLVKVNKTPKTVRERQCSYRKWNAPHLTMGNKITSYIFEKRDRSTLFFLFSGEDRVDLICFFSRYEQNRTIEVGIFLSVLPFLHLPRSIVWVYMDSPLPSPTAPEHHQPFLPSQPLLCQFKIVEHNRWHTIWHCVWMRYCK